MAAILLYSENSTRLRLAIKVQSRGHRLSANINLRWGSCYRHDPNATAPRPFVYEVGDKRWPVEAWRQGAVLIRNPAALHPLPENWFRAELKDKLLNGEVRSVPSEAFLPFSSVAFNKIGVCRSHRQAIRTGYRIQSTLIGSSLMGMPTCLANKLARSRIFAFIPSIFAYEWWGI